MIHITHLDNLIEALGYVQGMFTCTYTPIPIPLLGVGDYAVPVDSDLDKQKNIKVDSKEFLTSALRAKTTGKKLEIDLKGIIYLGGKQQGVVEPVKAPTAVIVEDWRVKLLTDTILGLYDTRPDLFHKRDNHWFFQKDNITHVWVYSDRVRVNAHITPGKFTRLVQGLS